MMGVDPLAQELDDMAAGRQAQADQSTQGAIIVARTITAFRKELIEGGLPATLANNLTHLWAESLLYTGDDVDE